VQTARNYLLCGPSYSQFCPKIRCHGNEGWQGENFNDTIGYRGPENRGVGANSAQLSFTGAELVNSVPKFVAMATGLAGEKFK